MKRVLPLLLAFLLCLAPCLAEEQGGTAETKSIILTVNGTEVPVIWEDNPAVQKLRELLPLTMSMTRFGGLQQVGYLEQMIQGSDTQTDAEPGDVILFEDRWIMLFYGYHSAKYTRLGRIPVELTEEDEREIAEDKDKTAEQLEEELKEAEEEKTTDQREKELKKETIKEFREIEKETEKQLEQIQASGLEEAEKQAKKEELKAQEKEKKTETLTKLKKIWKIKELLGGKTTITISTGE